MNLILLNLIDYKEVFQINILAILPYVEQIVLVEKHESFIVLHNNVLLISTTINKKKASELGALWESFSTQQKFSLSGAINH